MPAIGEPDPVGGRDRERTGHVNLRAGTKDDTRGVDEEKVGVRHAAGPQYTVDIRWRAAGHAGQNVGDVRRAGESGRFAGVDVELAEAVEKVIADGPPISVGDGVVG